MYLFHFKPHHERLLCFWQPVDINVTLHVRVGLRKVKTIEDVNVF